MEKRAPLRAYYDNVANKAQADKQYADRTAQLEALQSTVIKAFNTLIRFMDGKTSKTEVVNQLKSISTPDVDKVVVALSKLDKDVLDSKLDLNPVLEALSGLKQELAQIPKGHAPQIEQKETVKVSNLDDVKLDTTDLIKAIKALDLKVDVKAPVINTEKVDISPLKDVMLDLLKAFNKQKIEIPKFPEIPKTDLAKVEKKLDESNKHLKEIAGKRFGGGGGGGGESTLAFPLYANITTDTSTPGIIIETDGVKTLTTTYSSTSITEVWS